MVHFMRNVLSKVSHRHMTWAAGALKAVFAMESRDAALEKAGQVAAQMDAKGLKAAASCLREGMGEATTYLLDDYPVEHRRRIRTNNMIERLNREIRRRDACGRQLPGRQERAHAHMRQDPLRHRRLDGPPLPGHVPPR